MENRPTTPARPLIEGLLAIFVTAALIALASWSLLSAVPMLFG